MEIFTNSMAGFPYHSMINPDCTVAALPQNRTMHGKGEAPQWSFTIYPRNASTHCDIMDKFPDYTTSTFTVGNETWHLAAPPLTIMKMFSSESDFYMDGNVTFTHGYVTENSQCQPTNEYQWGFSFLLLLTFCIITGFVAVLLMALYYDAWCNCQADRYEHSISMYRDVLDLADALRAYYGEAIGSMTEQEVEKHVRRVPIRFKLENDRALPSRSQPFRDNVAARTRNIRVRVLCKWRDLLRCFERRDTPNAEQYIMDLGTGRRHRVAGGSECRVPEDCHLP